MNRTMTIILAILLVATNAAWAYMALDTGVTLDHTTSEADRQRRISGMLAALLVELPRDVGIETAAGVIRAKHPEAIIKRRGVWLEVDGVALEFRGDSLVRAGPLELSDERQS